MRSQKMRAAGPEIDPILLGTGWSRQLLSRPQVLLECTFGDAHPGDTHMLELADRAKLSCVANGMMAARYCVTDICDGIATGHDGMNYSLPSRDIISSMVEIHAMANPFDGIITFSSCDKATPAMLMSLLRINLPGIHVPGGSMDIAPGKEASDSVCYETNDSVRLGLMTEDEEFRIKYSVCPSCGACQYMGTASTMQSMAEALGISLPGSALAPTGSAVMHVAEDSARQMAYLIERDIRPSDIMTRKAFENALIVHAAISGSSNILLHLPAIATQAGIKITLEDFEVANKSTPVICNVMPSGEWPSRLFWYAGGIPAIMRTLKNDLNLDVMTVTGKTLGENLYELEQNGFFEMRKSYMYNYSAKQEDVIRPLSNPFKPIGGIAVLRGNIAPEGAIVKSAAVPDNMHHVIGHARPFDTEEAAIEAIDCGKISGDDIVVIRYKGPKASGMPELHKTAAKLVHVKGLEHCALITDGRFSGGTSGPSIGYVSPEAISGGPIGLIENDDLIEIDIPEGKLNLVGSGDNMWSPEECEKILSERKKNYVAPIFSEKHGVIRLYTDNVGETFKGALSLK